MEESFLSVLCVNKHDGLVESVKFKEGDKEVEYPINGITEHPIFGIYFSFTQEYNR